MESLSALVARKAEPSPKRCWLPESKIFAISGFLSQLIADPEDRNLLFRRIRNFVYSKRRGKLRLPQRFSTEARALSNMTKRQLGKLLYWVRPDSGMELSLNERQYQYVTQLSAVPIWNRRSSEDCHTAHSVGLARLSKTDAPLCKRRLWPSAPSFIEMLEMSRRGVSLSPGHKYRPSYTVENCITRKDMSDDIRLASRIVAKQIVGIRSSVEIPEDFLPWFRYRQGFSILSTRFSLPSGLVRFLLAQWKIRHTNLWLVDHCSLKKFLRKHLITDFVSGIFRRGGFGPHPTVSGVSSPSPSGPREYEDIGAEIDDEFEKFIVGLPS